MKEQVERTIAEKNLFRKQGTILVALSGGADSVALLLLLHELGYPLHALHCNFHLRGEESNRDEEFVTNLCHRLSIPLSVRHFKTNDYARQHKVSIEMAARDLRYSWFEEQRQTLEAQCIAVAHHRDDQAETVLLNILRGTGLKGLSGMKYMNGHICRPLLDVSRKDILNYLEQKHQDYVTDSTNLEREALRNRIRLDLIPMLAQLNPNIAQTLSRLAQNVQDALPIYERGLHDLLSETEKQEQPTVFMPSPFCIKEASLTLLHEWLKGYGFTRTQLQDILQARTGALIQSSSHRLLRDRECFILHELRKHPSPTSINNQIVDTGKAGEMKKGNAYLDYDKVELPIKQRIVTPSDRFTPFGMKGSRLVSDYLTDLKLNRFQKEYQEIVTDARDRILWIVGHASDNHFRITPSTRKVMILSTEQGKQETK